MERPGDPTRVRTLPGRAAFAVAAVPALVRASWRVRRELRRRGIEEAPARLRDVSPFAARWLARPADLDAVATRLLPLLPPRRTGRCLKRSLLLLDLWSRCGLAPRLHLGVRPPGEGTLAAHAWITTGDPTLDRRSGPAGHEELWSR